MSDISKIKINDTSYDIKDSNAVRKADNNIITGYLRNKHDIVSSPSTTVDYSQNPSENLYFPAFATRDSNDKYIGYMQSSFAASGTVATNIAARRKVDSNEITNTLSVRVNNNGGYEYSLSSPLAFRKAIKSPYILYFTGVAINSGTSAELARITDSAITDKTLVHYIYLGSPKNIVGNLGWSTYNGYATFTGTCLASTTMSVMMIVREWES